MAFAVSRSSLVEVGQVGAAGATFYPSNTAVASSPVIQEIKDMIMSAYSSCKPSTLSTRPDGNVDNTMGAARRFRNSTVSAGGSPVFVGSSMAFLLDELGHAVRGRRLATQIKEWINDMIMEDFEAWFVGDFDDSACPPGTKGNNENTNGETPSIGMPKSSADLAILNGNSIHNSAPPGEFRFDVEGTDSAIYVKILPLLASHDRAEREFLPVQLSPMFRLTTLLADCRYGGEGIDQVDAVLECPIFLPSQASSGMEFEDLSPRKQWVVTSSYYFVTCWIRQLINSFIDATDGSTAPEHSSGAPSGTSMSSASSQRMNSADVQKAIIARLGALVEVEEELAFTASKCYNFAPPGKFDDTIRFYYFAWKYSLTRYGAYITGLDILPPPKVLTGSALENTDENRADTNVESTQATKENKKANTEAKKRAAQMKKAKQKHEEMLVQRTFGTIRQLDPQVCVALGFGDLSIMGSTNACEGSQGLSQFPQVTTCGGPVTMMLLKLMKRVLSEILHNKKHQSHFEGGPVHDADEDNPYATTIHQMSVIGNFTDIALASCESSTRNCFALLNRFLWSGAFASLYEHLAAVAELRCGVNRKVDDSDLERRLVETARCLFSCIESVMGSEMLTSSATGRTFLCSILKQIAEGDRTDYSSNGTKRNRISTSTMKTLMGFISDNVNEIIVGAYTGDLVFAMDGVNCMQAIFKCSQRISDSHMNCEDSASSLSQKLFAASEKLLRQSWPDDTKLNKGNVGVLLSLFVEHSPDRLKTLSYLVEDVLHEVISLEKSEAVHDFSTCSPQTLGYFHSTALRFLVLEIEELFSSPLGNTKDPTVATGTLELLKRMTSLLQSMSAITNMHSTKKFLILQHLKLGTRYLETFVLKAVPFFQVHFREHQESILDIIRCVQTWSRGLYHIISHGKRKKEAMVAKEAPRANKALEMFIHKVKAMLKKNNCMTAMCKSKDREFLSSTIMLVTNSTLSASKLRD